MPSMLDSYYGPQTMVPRRKRKAEDEQGQTKIMPVALPVAATQPASMLASPTYAGQMLRQGAGQFFGGDGSNPVTGNPAVGDGGWDQPNPGGLSSPGAGGGEGGGNPGGVGFQTAGGGGGDVQGGGLLGNTGRGIANIVGMAGYAVPNPISMAASLIGLADNASYLGDLGKTAGAYGMQGPGFGSSLGILSGFGREGMPTDFAQNFADRGGMDRGGMPVAYPNMFGFGYGQAAPDPNAVTVNGITYSPSDFGFY